MDMNDWHRGAVRCFVDRGSTTAKAKDQASRGAEEILTNSAKQFTATGRSGDFTIQRGGLHPEAGYGFKYTDQKYAFWFYVEVHRNEKVAGYQLIVTHSTTGRFSGGIPIVGSKDQLIIEENIKRYFATFDLFGDDISPSNPAPTVLFTWTLPHDDAQ